MRYARATSRPLPRPNRVVIVQLSMLFHWLGWLKLTVAGTVLHFVYLGLRVQCNPFDVLTYAAHLEHVYSMSQSKSYFMGCGYSSERGYLEA